MKGVIICSLNKGKSWQPFLHLCQLDSKVLTLYRAT